MRRACRPPRLSRGHVDSRGGPVAAVWEVRFSAAPGRGSCGGRRGQRPDRSVAEPAAAVGRRGARRRRRDAACRHPERDRPRVPRQGGRAHGRAAFGPPQRPARLADRRRAVARPELGCAAAPLRNLAGRRVRAGGGCQCALYRGRLGAGGGRLPAAYRQPPSGRRGGAGRLSGGDAGLLGPAADVLGAAVRGPAVPARGGEGSPPGRFGDSAPHAFVGEPARGLRGRARAARGGVRRRLATRWARHDPLHDRGSAQPGRAARQPVGSPGAGLRGAVARQPSGSRGW